MPTHTDMKTKMKTEIITISEDGKSVEFIEGQSSLNLPLGNGTRRRLSHIRPEVFWKKAAFIILRRWFGDRGRIAGWTRTWKCEWRATIITTGESAVFDNRQAAVDWEYETLTSPKFEL